MTTAIVRLSVNLAGDVADALKDLTKRKSLTITEGIRRAIALWKFVEDEREKGNKIAVIEEQSGKTTIREIVLLDDAR